MGVPGSGFGGWPRGRGDRQEYWLLVGALVAVGVASTFLPPIANLGGVGVMSVAQIRRLHDLGRSGWWVAALLGAQLGGVIVLYPLLRSEDAVLLATAPLVLVPIVWLGAIPGQPHENRFGPAPGKPSAKDVFS